MKHNKLLLYVNLKFIMIKVEQVLKYKITHSFILHKQLQQILIQFLVQKKIKNNY